MLCVRFIARLKQHDGSSLSLDVCPLSHLSATDKDCSLSLLPTLLMDISYLLKLDLTACPRKIYDVWHDTSSHPLQPPSSLRCLVFSAGHL